MAKWIEEKFLRRNMESNKKGDNYVLDLSMGYYPFETFRNLISLNLMKTKEKHWDSTYFLQLASISKNDFFL